MKLWQRIVSLLKPRQGAFGQAEMRPKVDLQVKVFRAGTGKWEDAPRKRRR